MQFIVNIFKQIRDIFSCKQRDRHCKIGRNDPCWCGSKKKYKHCHLESDKKRFKNPAPGSKNDLSPGHRKLLGIYDFDDH